MNPGTASMHDAHEGPNIQGTLAQLQSHLTRPTIYADSVLDGLGHVPAPEIDRGGD